MDQNQQPSPAQVTPPQTPPSQIITPVQAYITPPVEEPEPPSFTVYAVILLVIFSILFIGGMYALGWYKAQLDASIPFSAPVQLK